MQKLLIVEDSPIILKILRHLSIKLLNFPVVFAASYEQAKTVYQQNKDSIFAALVDLNLPDAPNGEIADFCLANKLPVIVLTGTFDD